MRVIYLLAIGALFLMCCSANRLQVPRVKSRIELEYPLEAQVKHLEGEVLLAAFVTRDGKVDAVELLESSGHTELDSGALNYARTIEFEPGRVDDRPVDAWSRLLLRYRLTEVPFETQKWLQDVRHYQKEAANTLTAEERSKNLRKLYNNYRGLVLYIQHHPDVSINTAIRKVITPEIDRRYQLFWLEIPAAFAVFDDFLLRYPDSDLRSKVEQDLLSELLDAKHRLARSASSSPRKTERLAEMGIALETRLREQSPQIEFLHR
ncbi:MAG TPA: energy transducer TonB [bacterium]|nr:energy transducer TonB [bacterium]HNT64485.1 energy transducer TonB [bacterium]